LLGKEGAEIVVETEEATDFNGGVPKNDRPTSSRRKEKVDKIVG